MPVAAHFASARAELVIVERTARPIWSEGIRIGTEPGKYHEFQDHRCRVVDQQSIDFVRDQIKNGLEAWELNADDVPTSSELLRELVLADVERVRDILAAEVAGPNRPEIVDTAREVLKRAGVSEKKVGGQSKERARHETVTA